MGVPRMLARVHPRPRLPDRAVAARPGLYPPVPATLTPDIVRRPLTNGSATQPPRDAQPGWRSTFGDPAVISIAAYALVAVGAAVAAYLAVFTIWAGYDDEGTLLVTLQAFSHGATLYRDIYTEYGPFDAELFGVSSPSPATPSPPTPAARS